MYMCVYVYKYNKKGWGNVKKVKHKGWGMRVVRMAALDNRGTSSPVTRIVTQSRMTHRQSQKKILSDDSEH